MKLNQYLNNKKGSVTVFLCIFFVTVISMIFAFIQFHKKGAISASVKSLESLWCQSLLGEYDINLMDEYGIYGYFGDKREMEMKVEFYAKESFKSKDYIKLEGVDVSYVDYSLGDVNIFKQQLVDVGKLISLGKLAGIVDNNKASLEGEKENLKYDEAYNTQGKGVINNESVINSLPSKGSDSAFDLTDLKNTISNVNSVKDVVKLGSDSYFINTYIDEFFNDARNSDVKDNTYFVNEKEYLICGNKSDEDNLSGVKWRIVGIREVVNYIFLFKDPEKRGEATAMANIMTPGPEAIITEQLLLAAWALAESNNDYKILLNGGCIPAYKTPETWAVDLDSALNSNTSGYIDNHCEEGDTYEDYLNLFLFTMNENVKLLRVMDLIQINMRLNHYKDFSIAEYFTGVDVTVNVNGEEHNVSKSYYK